ncbi:MAG: ABC transporter ATP-binding protein, partial [Acetobacteraceae bacterium]
APANVVEQRVGRAAAILGLAEYLDRYPRQLSGGQRQRVAMGRAIVRDPKVFLFDEPLSNLDAKLRVQMRAEVKELHQRLKATTIFVTHDQIEAMTMADKIVVMRGGYVEQAGDPLTLYDRPSNLFVAGFIGSPAMNFIPGTIEDSGFRAENGTLWPVGERAAAGLAGRKIVYGVRPEHFMLATDGLPLTVQVIEPTGSETQIIGHIGGVPVVCAFRERLHVAPGTEIGVSVDPANAHLFDSESTARLEQ